MRLLLISNSTNAGEAYLEYPKHEIGKFLEGIDEAMFVPYAAVTFSFDEYLAKVQARFAEIGVGVRSVHRESNPAGALRRARAIVVGGGNTFRLVKTMQEQGLMQVIRERVPEGVPYVGWSAGSNVACPTICTTNDMPIVQCRGAGAFPDQSALSGCPSRRTRRRDARATDTGIYRGQSGHVCRGSARRLHAQVRRRRADAHGRPSHAHLPSRRETLRGESGRRSEFPAVTFPRG